MSRPPLPDNYGLGDSVGTMIVLTAALSMACAAAVSCAQALGPGAACDGIGDCEDGLICMPPGVCKIPLPPPPPPATDAGWPPPPPPPPPPTGTDAGTAGSDAMLPGTDTAITTDSGVIGVSDAGAPLGLALSNVTIVGNCIAPVAPDPWTIDFFLTYDNTGGAADVTTFLQNVELVFDDPTMPTLQLSMLPTGWTVFAGDVAVIDHFKVSSVPDLPDDCLYCAGTADLHVTVLVDGVPVTLVEPAVHPMCVP